MSPGESKQLKVYQNAQQIADPAAADITFTSSDTSIAIVSTSGNVLGVVLGNVSITVTKEENGNTTTIATIPVTVGG